MQARTHNGAKQLSKFYRGLSYGMGIASLGLKLFDLWRSKNWNLWFWAVFRDLFRRNFFGGGVRKNWPPPMTHSRHPAFKWYRFGLCVMKTVGGVTRTKWEKIVPDRRTDRQTENNIPFSRGIISFADNATTKSWCSSVKGHHVSLYTVPCCMSLTRSTSRV